MFRAARLEPRDGATHGGLRIVLLHLIALGSGALGLLGEHAMEGALVWLALWAPAMGAAGRGLELRWHGLLPLAWAAGLGPSAPLVLRGLGLFRFRLAASSASRCSCR